MSRLTDPAVVRNEYANEAGVVGRIRALRFAEGRDACEVAPKAVREVTPPRRARVALVIFVAEK